MKGNLEIEIHKRQRKIRIDEEFLKKKIEKLKEIINSSVRKISIYFVNNRKIKMLKKQFLGKNEETDVMTFKYSKNYGEIFISVEKCLENSKIYSNKLEDEILYVIIHGILHLNGYRDYTQKEREKMFKKQEEIFKNLMENEEKEKLNIA